MRALTVLPGKADSARIEDLPDPIPGDDELLVDGIVMGVCGTDREIVAGDYGWAPPGRDRHRLITRRVPLHRFADAVTARSDDIKVVLTLDDETR